MIEKIIVYKYRTSDGKLFDDEEIAKIYETKLVSKRVDVFTNLGIKVEYEKKYINDLNEIYENNKHPEHIPGVYMHYYIPTGETYVGSTEDLYRRHSSFINLNKLNQNIILNLIYTTY